jgi:hypothetical protein
MPSKRRHRLRDLTLYVVISLAVVATVLFAASRNIGAGWGNWIALCFFTVLLFYSFCKHFTKATRKHSRFWLLTFIFLILHLLFWVTFIRRAHNFTVAWMAWTSVPELVCFSLLADWVCPVS